MLVEIKDIQLERDEEGVVVATCLLLPGCISCGGSESEAILNFQEAAKGHLEVLKDTGRPIPNSRGEEVIVKVKG